MTKTFHRISVCVAAALMAGGVRAAPLDAVRWKVPTYSLTARALGECTRVS